MLGDEELTELDSTLPRFCLANFIDCRADDLAPRISPKNSARQSPPFSLISSIHASERTSLPESMTFRHDFRVSPATFCDPPALFIHDNR
jgi:hypothetical protein